MVLENIYRHLEMGEKPETAAEKGGREVALPVLAATLTTAVVFFPVTFLYGVSRFLFSALALAVVLALFASYAVAMTVVPLFCARFIKVCGASRHPFLRRTRSTWSSRASTIAGGWASVSISGSTIALNRSCGSTTAWWEAPCAVPGSRSDYAGFLSWQVWRCFLCSGLSFFPRTDAGMFVINVKAPSGSRITRHRKRGGQSRRR